MLLMKIKNSKVIFPDKNKYKIEYSDEIVDCINQVILFTNDFIQLLQKNKVNRLGYAGDGEEVLKHPFFQGLNI